MYMEQDDLSVLSYARIWSVPNECIIRVSVDLAED